MSVTISAESIGQLGFRFGYRTETKNSGFVRSLHRAYLLPASKNCRFLFLLWKRVNQPSLKPNTSAHLNPTSWFLNSFLKDYLVGNLWSFFYYRTNKQKKIDKHYVITSQNFKKEHEKIYFHSNYNVFIKFIGDILSKSRRTIIDRQLNSFLENCLKTQLVGFR